LEDADEYLQHDPSTSSDEVELLGDGQSIISAGNNENPLSSCPIWAGNELCFAAIADCEPDSYRANSTCRTDVPPNRSGILDLRLYRVQRRRRRTISKDWANLYGFWLAETM